MSERHVTIHGHFYQPPRENPWLEAVEVQDSAYPYHDWNERVSAECYASNAASRVLDGQGRIRRIVNNYARISFNFGPTLLAWMELRDPSTYRAILAADRASREIFSGHGSALAQAHSHLILPLANRRDKVTQVIWGIRDFEHRFDRFPEGMWLAETAVDTECLEVLAEAGIRFTLLAPHQAARFRPLAGPGDDEPAWQEVGDSIDPSRPYLCRLPSGREIVLFFYDGPISRAVAFEELLENGERFARRLLSGFDPEREGVQLSHIATDGETYGHHHPHGEMALSYALDVLADEPGVELTNYGEFLERYPPDHEVEIREETSWSCAHGIDRWRGDCGCHTGGEPGWHQRWREPLRAALDFLRDELAPRYEAAAGELLTDPWAARDDYVAVVLDRSKESRDRFFERWQSRPLAPAERTRALELLELQRHAMTMFTSCGWFFNELSGIETVQILHYAGRALQLAEQSFGESLEERFLERLERAESNLPEPVGGTGRAIYERHVRPARVDLPEVGAHYAVSSLFEDYPEETEIFAFDVRIHDARRHRSGRAQLAVGHLTVTSGLTGRSVHLSFGVLHFGDHHVNGGVRRFRGDEEFEAMAEAVEEAFVGADFGQVLRLLDRYFLELTYSLKSLFRDEQRRVTELILAPVLDETEDRLGQIYQDQVPLLRYLGELGQPLPLALRATSEVVVNQQLAHLVAGPLEDLDEARTLLAETASWNLTLDTAGLSHALRGAIDRLAARLGQEPAELETLERLEGALALLPSLPFSVNLWGAQNAVYPLLGQTLPAMAERAAGGDEAADRWLELFRAVADRLSLERPA